MTRVLIVEPDASARHATIALVRSLAPVTAVEGVGKLEQIWTAVERFEPELLIIDPEPYGSHNIQLLRLFRARFPQTCILVLTSARADRRAVRELPADVLAEKRLPPSRLRELIRAAINCR